MWLILLYFGFTFFFRSIYGTKDLRATVESLNISYVNAKFGEVVIELVPVSKLTNKVRGRIRFYYEPTDKLMVTATAYKLGNNNKAYKFTQFTRSVKAAMLLVEGMPIAADIGPSITPNLYWPPQENVTYVLHEYWLPESKVPVIDLPIPLMTGRFKVVIVGKYTNNTVLIKGVVVGKFFYSSENFDL